MNARFEPPAGYLSTIRITQSFKRNRSRRAAEPFWRGLKKKEEEESESVPFLKLALRSFLTDSGDV